MVEYRTLISSDFGLGNPVVIERRSRGRAMLATVLLAASVCMLWSPTVASAATASAHVRFDDDLEDYTGPVVFTAAFGEQNRVIVGSDARGGVVFSDAANPVRARGDCRQITPHTARCPLSDEIGPVRLRDGDDVARFEIGGITVTGGTGERRLARLAGRGLLGRGERSGHAARRSRR